MFLAFALLCIRYKSMKISVLKMGVSYLGVFLFVLMIGYISSRPRLLAYYDATANKRNTLSEYSQGIIDKLDGKLSITTYVNLLDKTWSVVLLICVMWVTIHM